MAIPFSRLKGIISAVLAEVGNDPLPIKLLPIQNAIIKAQFVDAIELKTVPSKGRSIIGEYNLIHIPKGPPYSDNFESNAQIKVASHLNVCWTRMVVVKEMCHCILDRNGYRATTTDQVLTLSKALTLKDEFQASVSKSLPFFNDEVAINAALEILCPIQYRRPLFEAYSKRDISDMGLAEKFRIPKMFIPMVFDADYTDLMEELLGQQ